MHIYIDTKVVQCMRQHHDLGLNTTIFMRVVLTYLLGTYASPGIIYLLSRELPTIIVVHLHSIRLVSLSCTEMHDNTLTDLLTTYRAYEYIHIPTIVQWM